MQELLKLAKEKEVYPYEYKNRLEELSETGLYMTKVTFIVL